MQRREACRWPVGLLINEAVEVGGLSSVAIRFWNPDTPVTGLFLSGWADGFGVGVGIGFGVGIHHCE